MLRLLILFTGLALVASTALADRAEELLQAARSGDRERLEELLASGVDIDATGPYGNTALIAAATQGHDEMVSLLLERGADPNHEESFYGASAVDMALFNGHPGTARLLLARGADDQSIRTGLTGDGGRVEESVGHSWRVLGFDKSSGEQLWSTEVAAGVPLTQRHFKATQANSTPTTDGRYVVAVFPTAGLACLDIDGNLLWRHELGGLNAGAFSDPGIERGFASSPILYESTVILQVDVHEGPYLAAWDLASGQVASVGKSMVLVFRRPT